MMKVLVTGAGGQLGATLVAEFCREADVVACPRADLDVTDHAAVMRRVARERPAAIVNCAAYNHVDRAEDEPEAAFEVNALAVRTLARAAAAIDAVLVHYSTDFVFDGTASTPYTEADDPNPQGAYAVSKLAGEYFAADAPRHYVLRVESLFGGPTGKGSLDWIVDRLVDGRDVHAFTDRIVSPSYVVDVARATWSLLERGAPYGLYHCVNTGQASWYELAREIARRLGSSAPIIPVTLRDVALRAPRPRFSALSNARLRTVGIEMPSWEEALARYLAAKAR
jgi:dTDP-4-dehydrorhamnose reductase